MPKKFITSKDLPIGKKPDPNFKPYRGPSITTANFQKFKKSPVVAAEKTTEVPVVDAADLEWENVGDEFKPETEPSEKVKAIMDELEAVVDPEICQGITKAGSRCKRKASEGSGYCPAHEPKE